MTSLASFVPTAGKSLVLLMIYACLLYGLVVRAVAKRRDREEAEQDAELERLCQEGQWLQAHRNSRRIMRGNCHVPAEERWSA